MNPIPMLLAIRIGPQTLPVNVDTTELEFRLQSDASQNPNTVSKIEMNSL